MRNRRARQGSRTSGQGRPGRRPSVPAAPGRRAAGRRGIRGIEHRAERGAEPALADWSLETACRRHGGLGLGWVAILLFAYWPTFRWVEEAWRTEPDYSHGYLVVPLAGLLCWHRRDRFPGIRGRVSWGGLGLIGLALAMRLTSRLVYADFLDGWSLLPLLAGAVWLLWGPAAFRWALPPIAFLGLMIPLPYQAESLLSWKLQGVATELSTGLLRVLGQPAVAEGHVIWVEAERLLVEQACSGMRIFIGVAALAFFWAAMVQRSWLDRVVLMMAVVPLAVFVNAVRITAVGILYQWVDAAARRQAIHDLSGYMMIPLAFVLLWLLKRYWEHLYRPVDRLSAKDLVSGSAS